MGASAESGCSDAVCSEGVFEAAKSSVELGNSVAEGI